MNMDQKYQELAAESAEVARANSEALKQALDIVNKVAADEKAAGEQIPGVVAQLKATGLIDAGEEKRAAEELQSLSGAVTLLKDVLSEYASQQEILRKSGGHDVYGQTEPVKKKAFYAVGERSFNRDRESDRAMARLIGD